MEQVETPEVSGVELAVQLAAEEQLASEVLVPQLAELKQFPVQLPLFHLQFDSFHQSHMMGNPHRHRTPAGNILAEQPKVWPQVVCPKTPIEPPPKWG